MQTLQTELDTARQSLSKVSETLRHLYSNGIEAEKLFRTAQTQVVIRLQLQSDGNPTATANAAGSVLAELRGHGAASDLPRLAALMDALAASPEWTEAKAVIQPLVDTIHELETTLADQRRAEDHRLQEHADAKAKALAEAAAKVEAKFAA